MYSSKMALLPVLISYMQVYPSNLHQNPPAWQIKAFIERTLEVNSVLHAVGEINPDALSIAQRLDVERAAGRTRGSARLIVSYQVDADEE